jgi:hypothetical protein
VVVAALLVVVWPVNHHQELTTALTTSGFTLERGGSSVVGRGLAG